MRARVCFDADAAAHQVAEGIPAEQWQRRNAGLFAAAPGIRASDLARDNKDGRIQSCFTE
jgi:hypothetical protein